METPAPPAPREETLSYEVDKAEAPSRPPPASSRPPSVVRGDPAMAPPGRDATLVGVSPIADDGPTKRQVVAEEAKKAVNDVASRVGEGLRAAGQSLAESTAGDFEALLPAELGEELEEGDPLATMGTRLVREADFWRRLALRALGRASFADRLGYAAGGLTVVGSIALAVVAGLGGLFAGGTVTAGRALLVVAGVMSLAVGGSAALAFTHIVRRTQRDLAREALARADVAAGRHHRLSTVLALRATDAKGFREALARLLDEASPRP